MVGRLLLFDVKKNKQVVENLENWLTEFNAGRKKTIETPLLLIDDEADSASVNTRPIDEKPTEINTNIRALLKLFSARVISGSRPPHSRTSSSTWTPRMKC